MSLSETTHDDYDSPVVRTGLRVLRAFRRSALLMFAAVGLVLIVLAGTIISALGHGALAGLIAASGIVIFVVNVVGYGLYKVIEYHY